MLSVRCEDPLEEKLQSLIAEYALKNKERDLLEALLTRSDISERVGNLILEKGSQDEVALWVRLTKPDSKKVLEALANIKSQKALATLAATPALGARVYREIFTKSKNRSVLLGLLSNTSLPLGLVMESLLTLEEKYPKEYKAINYRFLSPSTYFESGLKKRDIEIKKHLLSSNVFVPYLFKFATSLELKDAELEQATNLLNSYLSSMKEENLESLEDGARYNLESLLNLMSDIEDFSREYSLTDRSRSTILKSLEGLEKILRKRGASNEVTKSVKSVKKVLDTSKDSELLQSLESSTSKDDIATVVKNTIGLYLRDKISAHSKDMILFRASCNDLCDETMLESIFVNIDCVEESKLEQIKNPVLLGMALAFSDPIAPLSIIEQSANPEKCFSSYLKTYLKENHYLPLEVYKSEFLTIEHLLSLDTETFSFSSMEPEAEKMLIRYILSEIKSPTQWEHLGALGDSFQGSIGELIKVAKKL